MAKHRILFVLAGAQILAGCTTLSFAPPAVEGAMIVSDTGRCGKPSKTMIAARTVNGALDLTENYRIAYGCAAAELANGRRYFEVPSALALAGGATATALGAGANVAIATGAGSAISSHGNSYFAPKAKAHILAGAFNAVVCIKQEASGITALNVGAGERALSLAGAPSVTFSPEVQYYQLVSAALQNVHSILAERLSSIGSYAPDMLAKEIAQLAKEEEEAESPSAQQAADKAAKALSLNATADPAVATAIVEISKLQPRLKLCVIEAKAG